jgi:glycosyltransferase involved in cell wall biosynthesis
MQMTVGAPKVDVVVPVRNGARYLLETLSALREQTRAHNLWVCDSGSTDGTVELAREAGAEVLANPGASMVQNWNLGLSIGRAPYVCLMHADDLPDPEFLDRLVGCLDANPECGLASTRARLIDGAGRRLAAQWVKRLPAGHIGFRDFCEESLRGSPGSPVVAPTVMFRRDVVVGTSPVFPPNFEILPDWAAWVELLGGGAVLFQLDEVLLSYRLHETQVTSTQAASARWIAEEAEIYLWIAECAGWANVTRDAHRAAATALFTLSRALGLKGFRAASGFALRNRVWSLAAWRRGVTQTLRSLGSNRAPAASFSGLPRLQALEGGACR